MVGALAPEVGLSEVQVLVAEAVVQMELRVTPTLAALARCPRRVLVTFNYDDAIERSVEHVGLVPRPVLPGSTESFREPAEGEVLVIHLHGSVRVPESIVLPGRSTEVLNADSGFMTLLRALWARHQILYVGFRFGPAESHLRAALGWLTATLPDADPQFLMLPKSEVALRGEEWTVLTANQFVRVVPYDDTPGHDAVHFAALLLAPTNKPSVDTVLEHAPEPAAYYAQPPMTVVAKPDPRASTGAEGDLPDPITTGPGPWRLFIQGAGGMGKTQFLRAFGRRSADGSKALLAHLGPLPALLDDEYDACVAVARLLMSAAAFDLHTPLPTFERLETGRYCLLFDGLDEVGLEHRDRVIAALLVASARWLQHDVLIAGRDAGNLERLTEAGFMVLHIYAELEWGDAYLRRRGVPARRIDELHRNAPAIADLLGIPMYVAAIGESLIQDESLPSEPLRLLANSARRVIGREATKWGRDPESLLASLQRLALGLQITDIHTFSESEFEASLAMDGCAQTWRRRLLDAGIFVERSDGDASFALRTVQEVLAANEALRSRDLVRLIELVALTDIDGEPSLRDDIAQWLDLIWESATPGQRLRLRVLDEHRWFRTIPIVHDEDEAEGALEAIWQAHLDGELAFDISEGVTRGIAQTMDRVRRAHPGIFRAFDARLHAAATDRRPHIRATAMHFCPYFDGRRLVLDGLIDEDEIVRAAALSAATRQRNTEALDIARRSMIQYPERRFAYGAAIAEIADADALLGFADLLLTTCPSLAVVRAVIAKLPLPAATGLCQSLVQDPTTAGVFLMHLIARHGVKGWGDDGARIAALAKHAAGGWDPRYAEMLELDASDLDRKLELILTRRPQMAERGRREASAMRGDWSGPPPWSRWFRHDEPGLSSVFAKPAFGSPRSWSETMTGAVRRQEASQRASVAIRARLPRSASEALAVVAPLLDY